MDLLVDKIIAREKLVKYLGPVRGCLGQWIVLKEIHCKNRVWTGSSRCAIMLDPDPVLDDSMFRAAWGWKPNQDRLTTNAYRIAKVVVFTRCHAPLISHQGLPWRLQKSHESAHFESLLAEAENLQEKTRQPSLSKKTRRPNNTGAARDQLRQEKKRKQEVRRAYVLQFEGDMCCGKKCAQLWRTEPENASGCGLVHAVRTAYQALSRDRQREFIYNRMEETLCDDGHVKKRLFLESLSDMKTLLVKTHLRLKPLSFSSCQRVCIKFFLWVTGASRNKLYQPTNFSKGLPFSMDLPGRRQHSDPHASLKSTKVIKWLTNFASFHLHDPASKSIFVPFASRRAVYDLYVEESKDPEYRNFYTLDTDNQPNVPSLSYFLRVWKKSLNCTIFDCTNTCTSRSAIPVSSKSMHAATVPQSNRWKIIEGAGSLQFCSPGAPIVLCSPRLEPKTPR